jgi:hypothetical protein
VKIKWYLCLEQANFIRKYQFHQKSKNGEILQKYSTTIRHQRLSGVKRVISEKDIIEDKSTPIGNQIVGYKETQDQNALKSAGEIKYVDFN